MSGKRKENTYLEAGFDINISHWYTAVPYIGNALPTMEHSRADLNTECRDLNSRDSTTSDVSKKIFKNDVAETESIVCCVVDLDE